MPKEQCTDIQKQRKFLLNVVMVTITIFVIPKLDCYFLTKSRVFFIEKLKDR